MPCICLALSPPPGMHTPKPQNIVLLSTHIIMANEQFAITMWQCSEALTRTALNAHALTRTHVPTRHPELKSGNPVRSPAEQS
jgi:hypothetical protein